MDTIVHSLEAEIERAKALVLHLENALTVAAGHTQAGYELGPINAAEAEENAMLEQELETDLQDALSYYHLLSAT